MATVEERIAYEKAQRMSPEEMKAFLKGVHRDYLWDELRRRDRIKDEIIEMAEEIARRVVR